MSPTPASPRETVDSTPGAPRTHHPGPDRVIRGHVIVITGDPCVQLPPGAPDTPDELRSFADGAVAVSGGIITAVGDAADVLRGLSADTPVDHFPHQIISAGFVDTHVHYPQTGIIASYGAQLIDWLNTYTFPEEGRFDDPAYAAAAAAFFCDQLLANGTTTALTFCTSAPGSVDALFSASHQRGMRMVGGKVLMDRNAPAGLLDTAASGYEDSLALIDRWHGVGRSHYAVTPRFAPTSSREQLEAAADVLDARPGTLMHTHVSENLAEIAWVRELFPEATGYLDVYDRARLLRPGAVLAHGVHLTPEELRRINDTGSAIAHCPTSNLFLGSGLFNLRAAKQGTHAVPVGLGTDVGAGTSFSLLTTMNAAYSVAQLHALPLTATQLFYLATLGGAQALGLDQHIGSIEVGKDADLVVLDPTATPLTAARSARAETAADLLFTLAILGDERAVSATYVAGARVASSQQELHLG